MKILFIGVNPSIRSPDNSAFHPDTKSRKVIDSWLKDVSASDIRFINILSSKSNNNKPLSLREIRELLPSLKEQLDHYRGYKLVALGKAPTYALASLNLTFLEAPHPSGLNRKLNDASYVKEFLTSLKRYVEN